MHALLPSPRPPEPPPLFTALLLIKPRTARPQRAAPPAMAGWEAADFTWDPSRLGAKRLSPSRPPRKSTTTSGEGVASCQASRGGGRGGPPACGPLRALVAAQPARAHTPARVGGGFWPRPRVFPRPARDGHAGRGLRRLAGQPAPLLPAPAHMRWVGGRGGIAARGRGLGHPGCGWQAPHPRLAARRRPQSST